MRYRVLDEKQLHKGHLTVGSVGEGYALRGLSASLASLPKTDTGGVKRFVLDGSGDPQTYLFLPGFICFLSTGSTGCV